MSNEKDSLEGASEGVADKNSVSGAGDCSSKEARLVQAYESKVQDFARETLRSSEAITILQDVDKYLQGGTHDIATGHPKEKWGKQCKWCDVRQRIEKLLSGNELQTDSSRYVRGLEDAAKVAKIKDERAKIYFPSGRSTGVWAYVDDLLSILDNERGANANTTTTPN